MWKKRGSGWNISTVKRSKRAAEPLNLTDSERIAVRALQDKKAQNIMLIVLGESAEWARSLVICDAPVEVHRRALRDAVEEALREAGLWHPAVCHCEVTESWILMDLGDTIVNIFSTPARHYYDLERTWGETNNIFRF